MSTQVTRKRPPASCDRPPGGDGGSIGRKGRPAVCSTMVLPGLAWVGPLRRMAPCRAGLPPLHWVEQCTGKSGTPRLDRVPEGQAPEARSSLLSLHVWPSSLVLVERALWIGRADLGPLAGRPLDGGESDEVSCLMINVPSPKVGHLQIQRTTHTCT